ncbi:hypothetical protein [Thermoactinomyces vulgaris]|nr:hypothetical protein [Thermoactinomyces vulgaris]
MDRLLLLRRGSVFKLIEIFIHLGNIKSPGFGITRAANQCE